MANKVETKAQTKKGLYSTTHFVFPHDILLEVDEIAGKRKRSSYVVEATKEKIAREKLSLVLMDAAGAWKDKGHTGLKTKKDVERFARKPRQHSAKRLKNVL